MNGPYWAVMVIGCAVLTTVKLEEMGTKFSFRLKQRKSVEAYCIFERPAGQVYEGLMLRKTTISQVT